ncbi:unnamed protein product [Trichogramma brassicae]|uniref:Uncharacterized protein n=1 Tax=Trichogramma brassicae TaxID=86971 RepID=A0A6H5INT2_9HYME|nr:unnamed protein product [Trichogramma brassicae]
MKTPCSAAAAWRQKKKKQQEDDANKKKSDSYPTSAATPFVFVRIRTIRAAIISMIPAPRPLRGSLSSPESIYFHTNCHSGTERESDESAVLYTRDPRSLARSYNCYCYYYVLLLSHCIGRKLDMVVCRALLFSEICRLARPRVLTHGTRQRKSSGRMHLRERVATNELLLLLKGRRLPSGFASRSPGSDLRQICGSVLKRTRRFKNLAARRLASRRRRRRRTTTTTLASPKLGLDYYYYCFYHYAVQKQPLQHLLWNSPYVYEDGGHSDIE